MLCLWHVHKTWNKNAASKIKDNHLRVHVVKEEEYIMYSCDLVQGPAAVLQPQEKIASLKQKFPEAKDFVSYFFETSAIKPTL